MGKESLKMQTLSWCRKPTDLDGPVNCPAYSNAVPYRAVKGNLRKFRATSNTVQLVAPKQGAYENEGMRKENLKMKTLSWCRKRTDRDGPGNSSAFCKAV